MPSATTHARGDFDVKLVPQTLPASQNDGAATTLGRMSIDKRFHGDLEGTSQGEMLTAMTDGNGSGVYVAVERVSGTLHGRRGTFVLVHNGIATRDGKQLTVAIAPESGTGELTGIAGELAIIIEHGKHSYDLEYSLPEPA